MRRPANRERNELQLSQYHMIEAAYTAVKERMGLSWRELALVLDPRKSVSDETKRANLMRVKSGYRGSPSYMTWALIQLAGRYPDGMRLLLGHDGGKASAYDVDTGEMIYFPRPPEDS